MGAGREDKTERLKLTNKQTNKKITMKKAYIAPATGVYNIGAVSIIAASGETLSVFSSGESVNTSNDGVQLGREDNGGTNVWDSEW